MAPSRRDFLGTGIASLAGALVGCGREKTARAPRPAVAVPALLSLPPALPAEVYPRRRARVAAKMREEGFDRLLVTPGSNLTYLTGALLGRSERLIALVMENDGACRCLGPAFEADRLAQAGLPGELKTWEEAEDPIPFLAELLSGSGTSPRLAVEGTTWFDTLAPLARRLPSARLGSATPVLSAVRMKKEPDEIRLIQAAARITLDAIHGTMEGAQAGQTEEELLARAGQIVAAAGATLDGMVQFGPNSAVPHAAAGRRKLRPSDVILFDLVAEVRGYHSDVSRSFAFGEPPPRFQEVYRAVREAQAEGFHALRAGVAAGSVDRAARVVLRRHGFGKFFTHRVGHGLGLEVHEPPYLVEGNGQTLEEGMTVTVEPGAYLPGEFGVRLEDDLAVTGAGATLLSAATGLPGESSQDF